MKIGCPTEIKPQEFRVGMTPDAAREAINHGHEVLIQSGAGLGAGFTDADYTAAGAAIVDTAEEIFATAEMIVKVKEPQAIERKMLHEGQLLFTYLHLAPDPDFPRFGQCTVQTMQGSKLRTICCTDRGVSSPGRTSAPISAASTGPGVPARSRGEKFQVVGAMIW